MAAGNKVMVRMNGYSVEEFIDTKPFRITEYYSISEQAASIS